MGKKPALSMDAGEEPSQATTTTPSMAPPGMTLDPGTPQTTMAAELPKVSQNGVPSCPVHGSVLLANGTSGDVTYYYCQVEGCKQSDKMLRRSHAFARPMYCPLATCRANNQGKETALVMVPNGIPNGRILMRCANPNCQYEVAVTDPRMKGQPRPKRRADDLSER